MENNIDDDISHKKKLDDDSSSVNTDIPSDPWFDDQDMNCLSPSNHLSERSECNNHELSFIYSNGAKESDQKEDDVDLYSDLIMLEEAEKKSKIKSDAELKKLKIELEKLREADGAKSAKIAELTKENTNLKKSICSLYQTVKSEIEHKDQLLADANRKIDNLLFRKNIQKYRNDRADENKTSCTTSNEPSDKGVHKRKRSTESPKSSFNQRKNESSIVKDKNSNLEANRDKRPAPEKSANTSEEHPTPSSQTDSNRRSGLQTVESARFFESSRDSTETNNLFFKLIPSPLKKAFHDYEQSQIISLNKLKQSLINEYLDNNTDQGPNSKTCKSKELPKRHLNSVSSFLLTPCSEKSDDSPTSKRVDHNSFQKSGKITRSMQQDIVSLFKYKKEKVPFLDKRKFGLLEGGKDLVPKNL